MSPCDAFHSKSPANSCHSASLSGAVLIALGALAFPGCHIGMLGGRASKTSSFTVDVAGVNQCSVRTVNGALRCVSGDVSEIKVDAVISARAVTDAEAERRLSQITIDVSQNEGAAEIVANVPRGISGSVSMTLTVPASLGIVLETTNGKIEAEGIDGSLSASTSNGAVSVKDCDGGISVVTSNGKLSIEGDSLAELSAKTSNGAVQIKGVFLPGSHQIQTSNGSVEVESYVTPLMVTATTSNGAIKANGERVKNGETVVLGATPESDAAPTIITANLQLKTSNGSIQITHSNEPPPAGEEIHVESVRSL